MKAAVSRTPRLLRLEVSATSLGLRRVAEQGRQQTTKMTADLCCYSRAEGYDPFALRPSTRHRNAGPLEDDNVARTAGSSLVKLKRGRIDGAMKRY